MPTVHVEVESTYDVDGSAAVPDLVELLAAARARAGAAEGWDGPWSAAAAHRDLAATYYDTGDLRLAAAGLTLRRRTGGDDAGWHLKVPMADGSRAEVRLPLAAGADVVPERLRVMTHARTGGVALVPVARVETDRRVQHVVDPTGRVLLELADDRVTARRLDAAPDSAEVGEAGDGERSDEEVGAVTWREVEVEVVDGPPDLLAAVDPLLREHGLRPAATASKLARTLGLRTGADGFRRADAAGTAGPPGAANGTAPDGVPAAGDVVLAHVAVQVEQIRAHDLPVRLDAAGSVHAMRVATRRLRSALTTFEPLLQHRVTRPLARELRWLAAVLGKARDAEVVRARVLAAVAEEIAGPAPLAAVPDDVAARLDDAYATAHAALVVQLDGERYRALLDALAALLEDPPLRQLAADPAPAVLRELVAAADREVHSAMHAAARARDPDDRETLLHDARKAAKRARYAAEAVSGVLGPGARDLAAAMEGVQEAVGAHLDSLQTRDRLRLLADATSVPATAFALGRLHAREDLRVERSRAEVDSAWDAARREELRRWLG